MVHTELWTLETVQFGSNVLLDVISAIFQQNTARTRNSARLTIVYIILGEFTLLR